MTDESVVIAGVIMAKYFRLGLRSVQRDAMDGIIVEADLWSCAYRPLSEHWIIRVNDDEDPEAPDRFCRILKRDRIEYEAISSSYFKRSLFDPF